MKKLLVFVAAVSLLASCTSTKIVTDSVNNVDFSAYKTVKIEYQPNEGSQQIDPINAQRIESAIQKQTQERGLSEAKEADVKIVWGVGIDIQKNYSTNSTYYGNRGYGYRGRIGGYGYGSGYSTTHEYTTRTGTFQVALIDSSTDQVIWLGSASENINGNKKKADEKINIIIEKVFKEFPIKKHS